MNRWIRKLVLCQCKGLLIMGPFCRHTVVKGNFCTYCSKKLVKQCDCWVKKQKYNCGFSQCPGLKLELIQMHKKK